MKFVLHTIQVLLEVGVVLMIPAAIWTIALDRLDDYRWRKAKRSA